jgi:hypothetical protein
MKVCVRDGHFFLKDKCMVDCAKSYRHQIEKSTVFLKTVLLLYVS